MAEVLIEKITEDQFNQLVDNNLKDYYRSARILASVFRNSTDPGSYHTIEFNSPDTDELGVKAPALLRVIASPITDLSAVAKFVVAPYYRVPKREEICRWIKSGILIRKQPLVDILSMPNREYWSAGSNFCVALFGDDYNPSGIGIDEIRLHLPRNPRGSSALTIANSPLSTWLIDRVLPQLLQT